VAFGRAAAGGFRASSLLPSDFRPPASRARKHLERTPECPNLRLTWSSEAGWVSPPLSFALSCHAPSVLFVLPAVADSELHGT